MNGTDIRERRRKLGLTQKQLGQILGIPDNTISRWELGTVVPEHPKMLNLALKALEYQAGAPLEVPALDDLFVRLADLGERQEARRAKNAVEMGSENLNP